MQRSSPAGIKRPSFFLYVCMFIFLNSSFISSCTLSYVRLSKGHPFHRVLRCMSEIRCI